MSSDADLSKYSARNYEVTKSAISGAGAGVVFAAAFVVPRGLVMLPHAVVFPSHAGIFFCTYELTKSLLQYDTTQPLTFSQVLKCSAAAVTGEIIASRFSYPIENALDERVLENYGKSANKRIGIRQMIQKLSKQKGLAGFYKGSGSKLIYQVTSSSIFFPTYEFLKVYFRNEEQSNSKGANFMRGVYYGVSAGLFTGFLVAPLINAMEIVGEHHVDRRTTAIELRMMWTSLSGRAKKGITRFYARAPSSSFLMACSSGILMGMYEFTKSLFPV